MSNSINSQNPRSSEQAGSSKITPYNRDFEQKLIDIGIYPNNKASKPENLHEIRTHLATARSSLSPSRFTDDDFLEFQELCELASSESTAMSKIIPIIAGQGDKGRRSMGGIPYNNLKSFDEDLSVPVPDMYDGAPPSAIHPRVRADLGKQIIPSTNTSRPAAPNFFLEGKSPQARSDVAKRQALYDGAVGARAMHSLQNYKAEEPTYDDKAYSFSSTFHNGLLKIYAIHPTQPAVPGGNPDYHMTQVRSIDLTDSPDHCREGAAVYRNSRVLAKKERDRFIKHANEVAQQLNPCSPSTTRTDSRTSRSTGYVRGSDTSEDELARDEVTPVKRLRPSVAPAIRYGSASGRDGRTASSTTPMATDRASLPSPSHIRSKTRRGGLPSAEGDVSQHSTSPIRHAPKESTMGSSSEIFRRFQCAQSLGQPRQTNPMVEVPSKRMRHEEEVGWRIKLMGKSIFVADSQWTTGEQDGQPVLYCARLNVFIYRSLSGGRR